MLLWSLIDIFPKLSFKLVYIWRNKKKKLKKTAFRYFLENYAAMLKITHIKVLPVKHFYK